MEHFEDTKRWIRRTRGRLGGLLLLSGVLLSGVAPGTNGFSGVQAVAIATPGQYSPPVWFPLHRDVSGGQIKIGCTYKSFGTQGGYECGGHHQYWALDLLSGTGTRIFAAGAGFARNVTGQANYSGYGNVVVVDHGNNVKSLYAHMSKVLVGANGGWVGPNTVIGLVGSTGNSSTPHLHFETTSSGSLGQGSRDPGPLKACHGSQLLTYPQAWGLSTWQGIPWGTHVGYSDGTGCTTPGQVGATTGPVPAAATNLVADPAIRQPIGLLGLGGTRVTYSTHLHFTSTGAPAVGATVPITVPGRQGCSAVTDATGTAVCSVTYPLFGDPPLHSLYGATFAGGSSLLPSGAAGTIL